MFLGCSVDLFSAILISMVLFLLSYAHELPKDFWCIMLNVSQNPQNSKIKCNTV